MDYIKSFSDFLSEKKKLKDDGKGKPSETEGGKKVDGSYLSAKTKKEPLAADPQESCEGIG